MKRAYADTPEGQIHYRTDGEGDVLLLLHQMPSCSLMFEKVIPILGRHYRVIAPDALGYGDSDKPTRQMEIPDYAKNLLDFLDALGIEQVNVVGHHTGGGIAVELAASHPERVSRLIINGAPYWPPGEREQMARDWAPPLVLKEDGSHLMFVWNRGKKMAPDAGVELWQRGTLQTLLAGAYYDSAYNAMFRFDIAPRLPLLKCPTLLMCGENDRLRESNKLVQPFIPRVREAVVNGAGGLVVDQKTDDYVQQVLDFLRNPMV